MPAIMNSFTLTQDTTTAAQNPYPHTCSLVSPKARLTMGRGARYRLLPHRRKGPTGLPAASCASCATCPPAASILARSSGLQARGYMGQRAAQPAGWEEERWQQQCI